VPDIVVSGREEDVYLFSLHLLWNRLIAGDLCLYGTVSRTREEVHADLASKGWDVSPFITMGVLRIVDYFSLAEGEPTTPDEKLRVLFEIGEEALVPEMFCKVLAKEFHGMRDGEPDRRFLAMFESLERLVTLIGLENTLSAEEIIANLLKDTNSLGVALLCSEFASEETVKAIKDVAGVLIEIKRERKEKQAQRMVRVTKMSHEDFHTDWMPLF